MEKELEQDDDQNWKKPLRIIGGVLLVLLIILMIIPSYSIRLNPEPDIIPSLNEVMPTEIKVSEKSIKLNSSYDLVDFVDPADPQVKYVANRIVSIACDGNQICYAKAIYYFVQQNFQYIPDPNKVEYVEPPIEALASGGGDCESGSIVLASLLEAVGVDAQLVLIKGHAYVRIWLENAPGRYKKDGWIYLDWTCSECEFGNIPWEDWRTKQVFFEVP
jgi:hypothetical protein